MSISKYNISIAIIRCFLGRYPTGLHYFRSRTESSFGALIFRGSRFWPWSSVSMFG